VLALCRSWLVDISGDHTVCIYHQGQNEEGWKVAFAFRFSAVHGMLLKIDSETVKCGPLKEHREVNDKYNED
jgi:hypothetical protein